MTEAESLSRRSIISAVESGIRRAQMFLLDCQKQSESTILSEFIRNASLQMDGFKKHRKVTDIELEELLPMSVASNLKGRTEVSTLKQLLRMDLPVLRGAIRYARVPIKEVVLAMHRSAMHDKRLPRKKRVKKTKN